VRDSFSLKVGGVATRKSKSSSSNVSSISISQHVASLMKHSGSGSGAPPPTSPLRVKRMRRPVAADPGRTRVHRSMGSGGEWNDRKFFREKV
jgi:hypothetical protein